MEIAANNAELIGAILFCIGAGLLATLIFTAAWLDDKPKYTHKNRHHYDKRME